MESVLIPGFGTLVNDLKDETHWIAVKQSITPYEAKPRQYSVTTLINPPQMVELKRTRWEDVVVLASDCLYRLLGTTYHLLREKVSIPGVQREVPLKIERVIDGEPCWVSGRLDEVQAVEGGCIIRDGKLMGVYEATKGLDDSKVAQANLYGHAYREMTGTPVVGLQIVGLLRDWSKTQPGKRWAVTKKGAKRAIKLFQDADEAATWMDAQSDKHLLSLERRESTYPESQEAVIDVPLWSPADAEAYMMERLRVHLASPGPCSKEETWDGRRCENYCDVSCICKQFNKEIKK